MRRRGFALFIVMFVVAVLSVGALALLDQTGREADLVRRTRQLRQAESIADGAVAEVVNDERTPSVLPDYSTADLRVDYSPPSQSPFQTGDFEYSADVRLLRFVPVSETSQNWSRALVYEITTVGAVDQAHTTSEVRAQVYKTITVPAGTLLPRVHAR
ncbi:hypothetical protein L6R52_20600 [Myxococcota bacterium]|nr:hypothetical protein [Myxococcota bacterium]